MSQAPPKPPQKWTPRPKAERPDKPEDYSTLSATDAVLAKLKSKNPKTRREAIVALGEVKTKKSVQLLVKSLADPAWTNRQIAAEQVILAGEVAIEPLIAVIDEEHEDLHYWTIEALGNLGGDGIACLEKILDSPDRTDRLHIVKCLPKSRDPRVVDPLLKALGDADWSVRKHAAEGLELFGDRSVPGLQKAFQSNLNAMGNDDICFWSIRVLGKILRDKAIPVFRDLLANKDKNIRFYAVGALGETASEQAVDPLIAALEDPSWLVRRQAFEMLEKIGRIAVDKLKDAFFKGNDDVKYWTVRLIARILRGDAVEVLKKLLNTQEKELRYFIVTALGETEDVRVVPTLIECFKDNFWQIRQKACEMVALMKQAAIPFLEAALSNESEDVRYWSVRAIGKIGGAPAMRVLLEVKKHPNNRMRLFAIYALADIGTDEVIDPLVESLGDPSWPVRNTAGNSLNAMGKTSMKPLIRAIGHENEDISFWAQKVLAQFGDKAVQTLIDSLADKADANMRKSAIVALGKIGTTASLKPLIEIIESQHVEECETVVDALADIKNPELVERLLDYTAKCTDEQVLNWVAKIIINVGEAGKPVFFKSLRHESKEIRFWVAKVLATLEGQDVLRALLFCLKDVEPEVRIQAIQSLESMGEGFETVPYLVKMLEDAELTVRHEAYKLLGKLGEPNSVGTLVARFMREEETDRANIVSIFQQVESSNLMVGLLKGLNAATDVELQRAIVQIVEKICDSPLKRDLLVKSLDPDDPTAAIWGIKILSQFEDDSVVEGVIKMLQSGNATVVHAATIGLSNYLQSGNWAIRDKVTAALTATGVKVIKPLLMGTDRKNDFQKMNVFQVIENMGEGILPALGEMTQDKNAPYYHLALELYTSCQRSSRVQGKKWTPKPKTDDTGERADGELEDIMARMKLK